MGNFIEFEEKLSHWDIASDDIINHALDNIAKDVQSRVRSRIDTGLDVSSSMRAQSVMVRNNAGQLVIKTNERSAGPTESSTSDLFRASSATPTMERGQLIFRRIREEQVARQNVAAVESSVKESMGLRFSEYIENGIRIAKSENPDLLK